MAGLLNERSRQKPSFKKHEWPHVAGTHLKWVQGWLGPGVAWHLQGPWEVAISSGQTPGDWNAAQWKVTGRPAAALCVSLRLIVSFCWAPRFQNTEICLLPLYSINHLFIQLKIMAAHLLLPVQLVVARLWGDIHTAVLKPSDSFSMATAGEAGNPTGHRA